MVQEYLNEISPTIYGPNKPKTLGKPLKIPDLQTPASNHYKPATLYIVHSSAVCGSVLCLTIQCLVSRVASHHHKYGEQLQYDAATPLL